MADILAPLSTIVTDTVGPVLSPAGPPPGASDPSPAADESNLMNPLVAISIIKQIMTYAPLVEPVIQKVPDIVAKAKDAIVKFEAMDFVDGVTDIEAIAADLGLSQTAIATVMQHATVSTPPAAKAA